MVRFGTSILMTAALAILSSTAFGAYQAKLIATPTLDDEGYPSHETYQLISIDKLRNLKLNDRGIDVQSYPQAIAEGDENVMNGAMVVEITAEDRDALEAYLQQYQLEDLRGYLAPTDLDELVTLVDNGASEDRIDLVFMGDGYTLAEREKFFRDMQRLTDDMFRGQTFASYLPVFNVHAVFRPSNESGIGKNDQPKDTAYRLYRAGNTLRAIYPGDRMAIRASCRAAPGCDYPIVIANDPYYGGLGGEVAISTSSETSGTVVLRHELGHNFGRVGEEYDGGGYFGANHTSSYTSPSWKHWLAGPAKDQPTVARFIDWPWHDLTEGPFVATWKSSGQWASSLIQFSASGMDRDEALDIALNGETVPFASTRTIDRDFHDVRNEGNGFSNGSNRLEFRHGNGGQDPMFSNIGVYEYKADYDFERHFVSTYPVFGKSLSKAGYRPTDRTCLMRNMKSVDFCYVCQENNWLKFFKRIDLIDDVELQEGKDGITHVRLETPPLGQLRSENQVSGEYLKVRWYRDGVLVEALNDRFAFEASDADAGSWNVEVEFVTPEVRKDSERLLYANQRFTI